MKIIALTVAFTLMATLAASGDDVPFSAPPLPRPGEPDASNLESSGDGMKACVAGSIQTRWSCTLRDILVVLGAKGVAASYAPRPSFRGRSYGGLARAILRFRRDRTRRPDPETIDPIRPVR